MNFPSQKSVIETEINIFLDLNCKFERDISDDLEQDAYC